MKIGIKDGIIKSGVLIILTVAVLLSAINIVSAEDTGVYVRARSVGIDKNVSKEVAIIDITTNKTGHLKYIEWYYSKNETGKWHRDTRILHFNETVNNNVVILKIKRPLDSSGKPYSAIRALLYIDGKLMLNSMFKRPPAVGEKKSPGFETIISIVSIISIYLLNINLKRKKR